ncbi:hypothetical protein F2Q70_00008551 [Brassica cretica]|uniref:Uncharacterized protein n=2 Tax=Brassica cretica TaxID=69181 RepID=A0A3N6RB97_BRACR|nr:hypothetical protein F2Q68_00001599 [Brassica cretica]KAF2609845.1 hypothetical protein F2Q70_00008551 [Brassica cretica]KAF3542349.1 hypothetical protein DY000_02002068 [Brassica cretica]
MKPPVRACHLAVAEGFSFSLLLFLLFSYSSFTSFLLCGFPGDLAFTAKDRGWNRVFGFRSLVQLRGWSGRSRIRVRSWGFVGDSDFQLFYLLREAAARGSGGTASSSCLPCGDLDLLFLVVWRASEVLLTRSRISDCGSPSCVGAAVAAALGKEDTQVLCGLQSLLGDSFCHKSLFRLLSNSCLSPYFSRLLSLVRWEDVPCALGLRSRQLLTRINLDEVVMTKGSGVTPNNLVVYYE